MPNIKSSSKRDQIAKVRNQRNKARRSYLRTTLKIFDAAVASGSESAADSYKAAVKAVDRAVAQGIIHKNNAAHKKSRIAKQMNALAAQVNTEA